MVQKDEEHTSPQFAVEQHTGQNSFVEPDTNDVATDRQNMMLMQSVADDESSTEPSLMSNHSAYINVSQSDDDSQNPAADRGRCHSSAFLLMQH